MAEHIAADCFEAVVHVVPLVVVDCTVLVDERGIVPSGVDVAPEDGQAVENVEDGQADDVIGHVGFVGGVFGWEGEFGGCRGLDPEVVAVYIDVVVSV